MQGVTAAVVAFLFLALAIPSLIKNKNQYYIALIAVLVIILLDALSHMVPQGDGAGGGGFRAFCYVMAGFSQLIAVIALVLSTGGLSFRQLHGDVIEVLRRGETEKEIIIPLPETMRRKAGMEDPAPRRPSKGDDQPKVYTIDQPPVSTPAPARQTDHSGPLPLE